MAVRALGVQDKSMTTQMFALVMLSGLLAALLARPETPAREEGAGDLNQSALLGHLGRVRLLLQEGQAVDRRGGRQSTPLMAAAFMGHAEVVRLLLARGADVTAQTETGATALHAAVFGGHPECVRLLLSAGADRDRADGRGTTPAELARQTGQGQLFRG